LLCVNLQTSFMHPPFGFALFYLRGIADTLFKDKRIPVAVKSNDIYLGSIPWVIMQILLVVIVIFVPQTVTAFLDQEVKVDIDKVVIEMPQDSASGLEVSPPLTGAEQATSDKDAQEKIDDLFKK
jgi:Tripartite ATP-independent periplasmic transporter, DctM component